MTTLTKERRDAIRAAAEKATPGPWEVDEIENRDDRGKFTSYGVSATPSWSPDRPKSVVDTLNSGLMEIITEHDEDGSSSWDAQGEHDCAHIANCDPQTILALLDALDALDAAEAREVAVKPLEWSQSNVFGAMKRRGFGVFGEFTAFVVDDLTPEEVAVKEAAAQAAYETVIRSALQEPTK